MKKMMGAVIASSLLVLAAGCSDANQENTPKEPNQTQEQQEEKTSVSITEMLTKVKEQIAKDLKEQGEGEDVYVDGKLSYYTESNLVSADEEDPFASIFLEKMELTKDSMKNGIVLAPMINVKSDEIIILEAKDEKSVELLKTALEKEKQAQVQTWEQYLPDQYEKVKNNVIKTNGNYLIYITYENPKNIENVFDSFFK